MSDFRVENFTAGNILGKSFELYIQHFSKFLFLSILATLPALFYGIANNFSLEWFESPTKSVIFTLIRIYASWLIIPAIIYNTYISLKGETVSFNKSLQVCAKSAIPVLITGTFYFLSVILGTILVIIPGIIIALMYHVAIPVMVIENLNPIDSLKRSGVLTDGFKWKIFGARFFFGLLLLVPVFILSFSLLGGGYASQSNHMTYFILVEILTLLFVPWEAALITVIYFYLKWIKEGVDVEEYAAIFD